jgi:hypothetical protein
MPKASLKAMTLLVISTWMRPSSITRGAADLPNGSCFWVNTLTLWAKR